MAIFPGITLLYILMSKLMVLNVVNLVLKKWLKCVFIYESYDHFTKVEFFAGKRGKCPDLGVSVGGGSADLERSGAALPPGFNVLKKQKFEPRLWV
jgi:hypothetical protein